MSATDHAFSELLDSLYEGLRREARKQLAMRPLHTLQPTALLNEALVRLLTTRQRASLTKGQLCTYVSKVMRSVLVDHARARGSAKRGGGNRPVRLCDVEDPVYDRGSDTAAGVLAVHEALAVFSDQHPELAELAEMRFFGRMTVPEVAAAKGVPDSRVKAASLYLRRLLGAH